MKTSSSSVRLVLVGGGSVNILEEIPLACHLGNATRLRMKVVVIWFKGSK